MTRPRSLPPRLRCPLCLADHEASAVEFLCPPGCGAGRRHRVADMPAPPAPGAPLIRTAEQSANCGQCGRTLTAAGFAGCPEVIPHPLGLPQGNIVHVAVVAVDDHKRTLRATAAALVRALQVHRGGDARPGPADACTYRRWRPADLLAGTIDVRSGERPLAVRLDGSGGEPWQRVVCLHPWLLRTLTGDSAAAATATGCATAAAMTPGNRLARTDHVVLSVAAGHALAGPGPLTEAAAALATVLSDGGAPLPRGWLCLAGQEDLFLRLGAGAARPHEVAHRPAAERAAVLAGYVGGSARLNDTLAPLADLRWPHLGHLMFGLPLDAAAVAGLAPWAATVSGP